MLVLILFNKLNAQNLCGTSIASNHTYSPLPSSVNSPQTSYSLPIHFYIITDQGKLPSFGDHEFNLVKYIRQALNFANTSFSSANISFYPSGFTFYESSSLANNGENLVGLYNSIHDNDAINVYIVHSNVGPYSGVAVEPIPSKPINNCLSITTSSSGQYIYILAHELGHYFNLEHTHQNTFPSSAPETNCNS